MLIAFDLDGVLFDAKEIHWEALNMALRQCGHPEIGWDDHLARFDGLPTVDKLKLLEVDDPAVEPLKQQLTTVLLSQHSAPAPDLSALLDELRAEGHTTACVSNARLRTVNMILSARGLTAGLDVIVAADHCRRAKPNPEPYLRAMIAAGVGPCETLIVEDSPYGIQAAQAAGAALVIVDGPSGVPDAVWGAMCVPA